MTQARFSWEGEPGLNNTSRFLPTSAVLRFVTQKHPNWRTNQHKSTPFLWHGKKLPLPISPGLRSHPSPGTELSNNPQPSGNQCICWHPRIRAPEQLLPLLLAHCEITTYAPGPGFDMYFLFPCSFSLIKNK